MAKNVRINVKTQEGYDILHPETVAGQVVMAGYAKPAQSSAVTAGDTVNEVVGKLEKGVEESIPKADIVQMRGRSETKVMSQKAVTDAIDASGGGGGVGDAEPIGVIKPFAGEGLPDGYLWCDGASYPANGDYMKLYNVIGTAYNASGDAAGTFRVPDLRGRVGVGKNTGTFNALGKKGGAETHKLVTGELPAHNHTFTGSSATTDSKGSHVHYLGTDNAGNLVMNPGSAASSSTRFSSGTGSVNLGYQYGTNSAGAHTHTVTAKGTISNTGSGTAHNNLQPYLVCNYIIKYDRSYGEIGITAPPCIWNFTTSDWTLQDSRYVLSIPESGHKRGEHCVLTALYDTGETGVMKSLLSENTKDAVGNITIYSDTAFAGTAYIDRVYMVPAGRVLTVNGQEPDVDGDVAVKPQLAIFGITSNVQYPVHEYKQTVLNKTIKNDIAGCVLDTSTGNVTLPAGSYVASAFATFGGSKSDANVGVYVKNPLYTEAVKNRANIGYTSDPTSVDKTINVTTLFTITEPATIFMGARTSVALGLQSADYYTHLEIMKVG